MSRVGSKPIVLPKGVKISVNGNKVDVEGAKGKMSQLIDSLITVSLEGELIVVKRANDEKQTKAFHGLYRSLINNMVTGVSTGFSKVLIINGVGYRAEVKDNVLILNLGFSSPIWYSIPKGIQIACEGPNKITVSGMSKEQVGQVSAEIRSLREPEPYKGKGIKYETETVRRKVGKSGVKK